jgi:hypothetical protein
MRANEIAIDKKIEIFPKKVLRDKTPRMQATNSNINIRIGPFIQKKRSVDGIAIGTINGIGTAAIARNKAIFPIFPLLIDTVISL